MFASSRSRTSASGGSLPIKITKRVVKPDAKGWSGRIKTGGQAREIAKHKLTRDLKITQERDKFRALES
jgi:hypothetical protein